MDNKINAVAQEVDNGKDKLVNFAKSKIFDLLSAVLILGMAALSLGVIKLREINTETILNILIEMVPFYLVAMMLTVTNYTKGSYAGKATSTYKSIVELYSSLINALSGKMLSSLSDFCHEYNDKALRDRQTVILKKAALSYDKFNSGSESEPPLKILSRKQLKAKYGEEVARVVMEAKRCTVKNINANLLLGNSDNPDPTNIGMNELEISKARTAGYAGSYVLSILFITLISIRDIAEWGWAGIIFVIFKLAWIGGSAYMKYFQGYKDITISVFNHISRKCDILQEYNYWYSDREKSLQISENCSQVAE